MILTEQAENIAAIARYIGEQVKPRTAEAVAVRDEWLRFWSQLTEYEKNFEQAAYDNTRNFKLRYNRANARTDEERAAVEAQALHGLSSEQIAGEADRRTSTGEYIPPPAHGSTLAKVGIGVGLLLTAALLLRR